jgi:hypothetical protein
MKGDEMNATERDELTRRVITRTRELDEVRVAMMAEPRRDGRGWVEHAPDSVNATEVRVSERWAESWVRKLHNDPDVNPVRVTIDASRATGDGTGQAQRDAYAAAHGLRRPIEHERVTVAVEAPHVRIASHHRY